MKNISIKFSEADFYHKEKKILSKVNFEIYDGDFVYLIGRVGTGKSTILKTIYADLAFKSGIGIVNSFDLRKLQRKDLPYLRRSLGIVFQDFQLLTDRNINDNLSFVLESTDWDKDKISEQIIRVLKKVDLIEKRYMMPHQLSGGEQQRVAIARALLNNPKIIVADEPTGNLDPDSSEQIMKILFDVSQNGSAVLMATHNYSLMKKFPGRVLKVESGILKEEEMTVFDFTSLL